MLSSQLIETLANEDRSLVIAKLIEERHRLNDRGAELDKELKALEEAQLALIKRRQTWYTDQQTLAKLCIAYNGVTCL